MTVAVIGAGLVGTAVARRLLAAGFPVAAFDVDPAKAEALAPLGVVPLASLAEARTAGRAVLAVFDTAQVEDVLLGQDGLGAACRLAVVVSTCDPEGIAAIAARAAAQGTRVVECPLSGSSAQVAAGDALGLVAGEPDAIAAAADIMDAIAPRRLVVGRAGDGARAKLSVNLILGLNRAALAEGLVFAQALGLDPAAFLAVARASAAYSQVMDVKGGKMLAGDFSAEGKIVQTQKDFRLILAAAAAAGQQLPLSEVYLDLVASCAGSGEGELDNAAVIREIRRRTGDGREIRRRTGGGRGDPTT